MKNKILFIVNLALIGISGISLLVTVFDVQINEDAYLFDISYSLNQKGSYLLFEIAPILLPIFPVFFVPVWIFCLFWKLEDTNLWREKYFFAKCGVYTIIVFLANSTVVFSFLSMNALHLALAYPLFNVFLIIQGLVFINTFIFNSNQTTYIK